MEKIVIKLLENPTNPQLKLKYVGAIDYATPKTGPDGKTVTGLDENAFSIISIQDAVKKKEVQTKLKKEREDLEKLLGVELHPQSSFWDDFFFPLSDESELTPLDPANPMDRVREKFLVANRYVAPSREAIEEEDFQHCVFYLFRESEEISKNATKQLNKDKATAKLYLLHEENSAKLKLIAGYIFGYSFKDLPPSQAYVKIKAYLEEKDDRVQKKNIKTFLDIADKSPEEMTIKAILDKAIKKRIILVKNKIHRRGDTVLGNSYEEVIEFLSSPQNSSELSSLNKEVED